MPSKRAIETSRSSAPLGLKNHQPQMEDSIPIKKQHLDHKTIEIERKLNEAHNGDVIMLSGSGQGSSEQHAVAGAQAEDNDDEVEDADKEPRSIINTSGLQRLEINESWAGTGDAASDEGDCEGDFSDFGSEGGEPEAPFELADDDDDYDGIDKLSVTSDDSHKFEEDVEQEILAAGESGIDWDDEETYGYTTDWRESQYFFPSPNTIGLQPLPGFDILDFDLDAEPAPAVAIANQPVIPTMNTSHTHGDWPSSSSNESDNERVLPSRRVSQDTGVNGGSGGFQTESGYETDEEDIPIPTVSSPALALIKRTPHKSALDSVDRRITASTPPRKGLKRPVMRQLTSMPKKAIAYSVASPMGRVIHFRTTKGSNLKWIDLHRRDSSSDGSSPSSPTMIDLDAALGEGNTRTGASITDVIYGQMFRQYHCSQPETVPEAEPTAFGEFSRVPFLNGVGFRGLAIEDAHTRGLDMEQHRDALELIDFDGGVTADETSQETNTNTDPEMTDITEVPSPAHDRRDTGKCKIVDSIEHYHHNTRALRHSSPMDTTSSPTKRSAAHAIEEGTASLNSKRKRG